MGFATAAPTLPDAVEAGGRETLAYGHVGQGRSGAEARAERRLKYGIKRWERRNKIKVSIGPIDTSCKPADNRRRECTAWTRCCK